jgi:hypothetical protein
MKYPVEEQETETLEKADPLLFRLAKGGIGRDYHIAEKFGVHIRKIPCRHGKRKYICRFVKTPVVSIQPTNTPVTNYCDGQFAIGESQGV